MVDSVLIISLGRSPPVVTETVDALLERNINLRRVYCVSTNDEVIQKKCIPLLQEEFTDYCHNRIEFNPWYFVTNTDIATQEDHLESKNLRNTLTWI